MLSATHSVVVIDPNRYLRQFRPPDRIFTADCSYQDAKKDGMQALGFKQFSVTDGAIDGDWTRNVDSYFSSIQSVCLSR